MLLGDSAFFGALRTRMRWHEERQHLLAENVANANTPGFVPRDLAAPDFRALVSGTRALAPVTPATTQPGHISGTRSVQGFRPAAASPFEVLPNGNAVTLEQQMLLATGNQLDYGLATTLYEKNIGMMRLALGRS